MNTAAYFFAKLNGKVAVSNVEHSSSWLPFVKAEGDAQIVRPGSLRGMECHNRLIQKFGQSQVVRYNIYNLDDIERVLSNNNVKLLVLTASSNLTGYVPPIAEIGKLAHKYGAQFLVDGCQYIQHHPTDMVAMGIDWLAASGHKFYAPYGGGFLIGPGEFLDHFLPYQIGGGNLPYIKETGEFMRYHNQLAHDPGTPNALGAVTMAAALTKLMEIGLDRIAAHESSLALTAYDGLSEIPSVSLYADRAHLSTVIPFNVEGIPAREVARRLNDDFNIGVRAGSFCVYHVVRDLLGTTDADIVPLVKAGRVSEIPGIVRASFALCNTMSDAEALVTAVKKIAEAGNV
jgi:cysteine desulfurase